MFRPMRRKGQELPAEAAEAILAEGQTGVLAVLGDGGYPYTVPVNYVYRTGSIYFHCALTGHKLDAIRAESRVSFCVIAADRVVPQELATLYRSAIAFGRARVVTDDASKNRALELLAAKYSPGYEREAAAEIGAKAGRTAVVEIEVEHLTGKQANGLTGAA